MKRFLVCLTLFFSLITGTQAQYQRNEAVQVEKVLFGQVLSVRDISEQELIEDKNQGWKVFGGALLGGVIGNQFGSGSGRTVATILGTLIGGLAANKHNPQYRTQTLQLVELMIRTEDNKEYMVVQDYDAKMLFSQGNEVRMVYLANGFVRIDKQM